MTGKRKTLLEHMRGEDERPKTGRKRLIEYFGQTSGQSRVTGDGPPMFTTEDEEKGFKTPGGPPEYPAATVEDTVDAAVVEPDPVGWVFEHGWDRRLYRPQAGGPVVQAGNAVPRYRTKISYNPWNLITGRATSRERYDLPIQELPTQELAEELMQRATWGSAKPPVDIPFRSPGNEEYYALMHSGRGLNGGATPDAQGEAALQGHLDFYGLNDLPSREQVMSDLVKALIDPEVRKPWETE